MPSRILHHQSRALIIGVGNDYRRDDAAGLAVARRLKERRLEHFRVIEQSGEGAALLEAWKNTAAVILIDAVHAGAAPGTIYRLDAHVQPIPAKFFHYSTHAFSVAEAIELARALGQLPPRLILFGIAGRDFSSGAGLSAEVESAVQEVVKRIEEEAIEKKQFQPVS